MLQVGDWDKALALAPAASVDYWSRLLQRHADHMAQEGATAKDMLPLMVATGNIGPLIDKLMSSRQYNLAANVAAVQSTG